MFEDLNLQISLEEIKKGVWQLRNSASAGPDFLKRIFEKWNK